MEEWEEDERKGRSRTGGMGDGKERKLMEIRQGENKDEE